VQVVPEIGLHTTLRFVVNRPDPEYLRMANDRPLPVLDDAAFESVGDQRVQTWPQLLQALVSLDRAPYVERDELPAAGPDEYVHWKGADWVRVRLWTAESPPRSVTVWSRVGRASP